MGNMWIDGIMGVVVGDALGMPVQFCSRDEIKAQPIKDMEGYGNYNMPPGTWSDDSSMTIATMDSIRERNGIDCFDIMKKFAAWNYCGEYTPYGGAFDQGYTCLEAIGRFVMTKDCVNCGKTGEMANGNGALMRIMPVCLYSYVQYRNDIIELKEAVENVHRVSGLTHNHLRSKMACGIYFFMVMAILSSEGSLVERLQKGMDMAGVFYKSDIANMVEWSRFGRLSDLEGFSKCPENDIKSSGYVLDTIEAAVWSLITTNSFEEALLRAVNLGDDTDTVGAIAGGLGGLFYGYDSLSDDWRDIIVKGKEIEALCELMEEKYYVR